MRPLALVLLACACSATVSPGRGDGGAGGNDLAPSQWSDFPSQPILDMPMGGTPAPPNSAMLFGDPSSGTPSGGPCVIEPEPAALYPNNWLRMRVRWIAPTGQNLFEVRVHSPAEANDLVVYTTASSWTLPASMWGLVAAHLADQPITLTVRGAVWDGTQLTSGPMLGTQEDFGIAPVGAAGAIVYWTTTGGSALKGFEIGDETVHPVLTPSQVQMPTVGGASVTCVGCHTSTPDGMAAGFTAQGPWGNALASIVTGSVGAQPSYVGPGAVQALGQSDRGIETFSKTHFSTGDRIEIAPTGAGASSQLAWFDLEAQTGTQGVAWGTIARMGDSRGAGAPAWSHDGSTVAYVSTDSELTGRLDVGDADLYTVPYNARMGGAATPVPGASDASWVEYYPSFSSDDRWLAFDRAAPGENMYNQPNAELFVIPPSGGTATRLAANDPPACTGLTSPGVTNSWPKWSPDAASDGQRTFYWLTFSSTRAPRRNPQLYVTAVVVTAGEQGPTVETHGAIYLWNQPEDENNHTPAWDVFQVPVQ